MLQRTAESHTQKGPLASKPESRGGPNNTGSQILTPSRTPVRTTTNRELTNHNSARALQRGNCASSVVLLRAFVDKRTRGNQMKRLFSANFSGPTYDDPALDIVLVS